MNSQSDASYIPRVPDAPEQIEEFLPIVVLNGEEFGRREQVDICTSYERAVELARLFRTNVGHHLGDLRLVVLKRRVGPWAEAS